MQAKHHQTPFWFELLLLIGLVGLVNRFSGESGTLESRGGERKRLLGSGPHAEAAEAHRAPPSKGAFTRRPSEEPRHLQHARAREPGRGRDARSPFEIPLNGWRDVFWRILAQINNDRLLAVAAGVVFYGLLALFPAVTALVSIYGLVADAGTIAHHLNLISAIMPEGGLSIIQEQVQRITQSSNSGLSLAFVFGLGIALWSANAGMKAIIDALNVVYDEKEKRSYLWLTLVSFAFTLGALFFVIAAVNAVVVLPLVLNWIGIGNTGAEWISILRWPALVLIVLVWLAVLYHFGPSRARPGWRWLSIGSIFAALVWMGSSWLFSWYLSNFANYQATYGSLGAAIGLMMWMWISVIVILVGAEINAELEHQTAVDTTTGTPRPLGSRGATMADTVGVQS